MAFSVIASVGAAGSTTGATTGTIDTTGANLIIGLFPSYVGGSSLTFGDSKGNTWTPLSLYSTGSDGELQFYYTVPTTVGSNHDFTTGGSNVYGGPNVLAVSGVRIGDAFDRENGGNGNAASFQPGSTTPFQNDSLIVAGIVVNSNTDFATAAAVDSGFTITNRFNSSGTNYGHALAYKIQTSLGAENPTWTYTSNTLVAANIAVFKPGAAGVLTTLINWGMYTDWRT